MFTFKYHLHISAFDVRGTSAKEVLTRLMAQRFRSANKRLQINTDIHNFANPPQIVFKFFDGTEVSYDCLRLLFLLP